MIRVNNLHIPLSYNDDTLRKKLCRELKIKDSDIKSLSLFRRSVDARKKDNIYFLCSVDVELYSNENTALKKCKNAVNTEPYSYTVPEWKGTISPLVVGAGPAGLFAALILAQSGAKPILIERGKDVDSRTADVNSFWNGGKLNTSSNVQFCEGGAGTFSDGKLNTGTKDSRQRNVLNEFVSHGAPEEILYNAKPHIGTDKLKITVKNIREEIIALGGTVMFEAKLTDINQNGGKVTSVTVEKKGKNEIIETNSVILAIGHSARDTFEMLNSKKLPIEAKAFSVGARIEHLREEIDKSQYGKFAGSKALGAAYYKLNTRTADGRGAYTFCMCPGGKVVNASSEENMLCTNGMSEFARNEVNSNAALLVGVTPKDYDSTTPLGGMYFQRELERSAFMLGGGDYTAPVQTVKDFINGENSGKLGAVKPSIMPAYECADLNKILPKYVADNMKTAISDMGKKLKGFDNLDAVLTGLETRSSSPIRIIRDNKTLQSIALDGLYPCGEGAGYAGGIISAAVDGIKCAEAVIENNN